MRIIIEPDDEDTGLAKVTICEALDHNGEVEIKFRTALVPTIEIKGNIQAEICVPADAHLSTEAWHDRRALPGIHVYKAPEVTSDSDL